MMTDIDMHLTPVAVDPAQPETLWNDWGIVASFNVGNSSRDYEPERRERCRARAAYAATAINAHADLLAACKAALEALEDLYLGTPDESEPADVEEALEQVRAAIAQAEPDTTKAVAS